MVDQEQVKEWQKFRRQSLQALPIELGLFLIFCGVLFLASRFISVPTLLVWLLIGLAGFSVLGDAINVVYLGYKLRRAKKSI